MKHMSSKWDEQICRIPAHNSHFYVHFPFAPQKMVYKYYMRAAFVQFV